MTQQPTVFSNHYYRELLAGGGAFPSDKGLLADPATAQWVRCKTESLSLLSDPSCLHATGYSSVSVPGADLL